MFVNKVFGAAALVALGAPGVVWASSAQSDSEGGSPPLVEWYDVAPGVRSMPTIDIADDGYPDRSGVQFLIDGEPDDRNPRARPSGFDATGPHHNSTFHVYPATRLADGTTLEARWTDSDGVAHVSRHVVGADVDADAPLASADDVDWTSVAAGKRQLPTVDIDDSIYPNRQGVQFFVNGEPDDRRPRARPDGWDSTGPQDNSAFHVYPRLRLRSGDTLEARWTDRNGESHRTTHVVGSASPPPPVDATGSASSPVTPSTTGPTPTSSSTLPSTTAAKPPVDTAAPPASPAATVDSSATTTEPKPAPEPAPPAAPTPTPPATTAAPTPAPPAATTAPTPAPPAAPPAAPTVLADWSDVAAGPGRLPTTTIRDEVYPDARGVQFRINGAVDDRKPAARPNGWDATGPRDNSTFHVYPAVRLAPGDSLEARWTDRSGRSHRSVHVVGGNTAVAPAPAPPAPPPAPSSPTPSSPTPGAKPGAHNTGPQAPLTRTFSSALIDESWLRNNNGGSRVIDGVHFTTMVRVRADNVTIRNFKVTTTARYGIENDVFSGSPTTGLVLEDGEITGPSSSGLLISNAVVRRLEIHHMGADAIKPFSNVLVEASYIHHLGSNAGSHSDGVQMVSGGDVVIRGNAFEMPRDVPGYTNSQVFMIAPNNGPIRNVTIERNWINGGSISVQLHSVGGTARIVDNRFGRDYRFGLFSTTGPVVRSGNVWDDNGTPI